MTKLSIAFTVVLICGARIVPAWQKSNVNPRSWSGVIINGGCTVDEAFAESDKCFKKAGPGAKLSLYDDTIRQIYELDAQDQAAPYFGDSVTVEGALQGNVIQVAKIRKLTSIGIEVGQKAPGFSARDQFGREQNLETLKGPKGTILLFFRSADWWPYCKGQLVELQSAKPRFEQQGIKLAAISYDSEAILKSFADRQKIEFPMLADLASKAIRDYHVLNTEAVGQFQGMARPGYFYIDPKGSIREKFFEAKYRERLSGNNVIAKLFPELGEEVISTVQAPHLEVGVQQSDRTGVPGSLITLVTEVRLPRDIHVYAPGTKGYKTVELVIDPRPDVGLGPAIYPRPKILFMSAIHERVPVFEGTFRIRQDVRISSAAEFSNSLGGNGKTLLLNGTLHYQACDSRTCFLPNTVPVQWQVKVLPLDRQRAPEDIQHK